MLTTTREILSIQASSGSRKDFTGESNVGNAQFVSDLPITRVHTNARFLSEFYLMLNLVNLSKVYNQNTQICRLLNWAFWSICGPLFSIFRGIQETVLVNHRKKPGIHGVILGAFFISFKNFIVRTDTFWQIGAQYGYLRSGLDLKSIQPPYCLFSVNF